MADEPATPTEIEEPVVPEPTPPAEETPEQVPEETPDEASPEETPEPEEEPEETPPSRREQLRIQDLLTKYGPPSERTQKALSQRTDALDYQNALDADPEVIQQLLADRQREGQVQYNEGLRQAEFLNWKTSLKIDAPTVEKQFPILDPKAPEFHPAVADAINNWYLKMSGFDPNTNSVSNSDVSYADFVEGYMELVQETAGQKNAQTVRNVAKQAASTGLRPDGSSAKRLNLNQSPDKMNMEELYAAIGQKPPK